MTTENNTALFQSILAYVRDTIFPDLSPTLYYHAAWHTLDDVLPRSEELARLEGIDGNSIFLLKVAALFHDTGFTKKYNGNEAIGAELAETALKMFGFTKEQILAVRQMIMATVMSETPGEYLQSAGTAILEQIICDADLDNLGRDDFLLRGENLRTELSYYGKVMTDREWYMRQLYFLKSHHYYTESAQRTRNSGKEKNIARLNGILETIK